MPNYIKEEVVIPYKLEKPLQMMETVESSMKQGSGMSSSIIKKEEKLDEGTLQNCFGGPATMIKPEINNRLPDDPRTAEQISASKIASDFYNFNKNEDADNPCHNMPDKIERMDTSEKRTSIKRELEADLSDCTNSSSSSNKYSLDERNSTSNSFSQIPISNVSSFSNSNSTPNMTQAGFYNALPNATPSSTSYFNNIDTTTNCNVSYSNSHHSSFYNSNNNLNANCSSDNKGYSNSFIEGTGAGVSAGAGDVDGGTDSRSSFLSNINSSSSTSNLPFSGVNTESSGIIANESATTTTTNTTTTTTSLEVNNRPNNIATEYDKSVSRNITSQSNSSDCSLSKSDAEQLLEDTATSFTAKIDENETSKNSISNNKSDTKGDSYCSDASNNKVDKDSISAIGECATSQESLFSGSTSDCCPSLPDITKSSDNSETNNEPSNIDSGCENKTSDSESTGNSGTGLNSVNSKDSGTESRELSDSSTTSEKHMSSDITDRTVTSDTASCDDIKPKLECNLKQENIPFDDVDSKSMINHNGISSIEKFESKNDVNIKTESDIKTENCESLESKLFSDGDSSNSRSLPDHSPNDDRHQSQKQQQQQQQQSSYGSTCQATPTDVERLPSLSDLCCSKVQQHPTRTTFNTNDSSSNSSSNNSCSYSSSMTQQQQQQHLLLQTTTSSGGGGQQDHPPPASTTTSKQCLEEMEEEVEGGEEEEGGEPPSFEGVCLPSSRDAASGVAPRLDGLLRAEEKRQHKERIRLNELLVPQCTCVVPSGE